MDRDARQAGTDEHWGWYADRNQLFRNNGKGHFTDVSPRNPAFCGGDIRPSLQQARRNPGWNCGWGRIKDSKPN